MKENRPPRAPAKVHRLTPVPRSTLPSSTSSSPVPFDGRSSALSFRIQTPQSDVSNLGDLMFAAGVLPQPTANTPALLVHPTSLISAWTKGENTARLAQFLSPMGNGERGHENLLATEQAKSREESTSVYVTSLPNKSSKHVTMSKVHPHNGAGNHNANTHHNNNHAGGLKLMPLNDMQLALQRLQETMRSVQMASGQSNLIRVDAVERAREEAAMAKQKDESQMSRVELWHHKRSLLPQGSQTPTFDHEESVRYIPTAYVERRIYDIRFDPQRWFELKERVQELKKEKLKEVDFSIVERNRCGAGSVSPTRKRELRDEHKVELREKMEAAQRRRQQLDEERTATTMTREQRTALRLQEQSEMWIPLVVLGARVGCMLFAALNVRSKKEFQRQTQAACAIQRTVRRKLFGEQHLSHVRAFVLRARLLRRFYTRVQVQVLRPKYTDMVIRFLKSIRFETRILMAFRRLHDRVVRAQRLVRSWLDEKRFIMYIRGLQWDKCVVKRVRDFTLMAVKGSSLERDLAAKELEDLRGITPQHKEDVLSRFREETRSLFMEAMRYYSDARKEVQRAGDARTAALLRKQMPPKPHIRCLIPPEQIDRMVRNASRHIRLQRQLHS